MKLERVIVSEREVCTVAPADSHTCGDPAHCHGLPHKVHTRLAGCVPMTPGATTATPLPGEFDCLLIRHGIAPNPLLGRATITENLLPHHVPE